MAKIIYWQKKKQGLRKQDLRKKAAHVTERKRNFFVSELHYHTTKFFTENLLVKDMKKMQIFMNKSVYLGLSILELSKMIM